MVCLQCAEIEADPKPQAVCCVDGSRGHLLHEDRDLICFVCHYVISSYNNAGTREVLNSIG